MANEGLGRDSLLKMVHNPGDSYWEGGQPNLVGKISRSNLFFQGPGRLSESEINLLPRSLTASLPLKNGGKGRQAFPKAYFQGRAVKLRGGRWWFQFLFIFTPTYYLGKIPILTSIFFKWVETTN